MDPSPIQLTSLFHPHVRSLLLHRLFPVRDVQYQTGYSHSLTRIEHNNNIIIQNVAVGSTQDDGDGQELHFDSRSGIPIRI